MTAPVLFVVPCYNRAAELPRTLRALAAQDWPRESLSVLVVDNGSTDGTAEVVAGLAARLPIRIEALRQAPEGPVVARNIGLARAPGHGYVAFVDSDVELDPGWTAATVAAMQADPGLAMVGGKVVFAHAPGVLNSYGATTSPLGLCWDLLEGAPVAAADAPRDVLWMNASAILARPRPLQEVGGFDESFFYGAEEPDLGQRLALAGWRCRVVPGAVALHHVRRETGPSHPDVIFHSGKNRLRMGLKCYGARRLAWWVPAMLGFVALDALLHPPRARRLGALWWNLRHLRGTLAARRRVRSARVVPDAAVYRMMSRAWFPPTRLRGMRRRAVEGMTAGAAADDRAVR